MRCLPLTALAVAAVTLTSCWGPPEDGPPAIRVGDSVCVECDMIISDERFATATFHQGPRGRDPLLFDDFNCWINHELAHPEREHLDRWVRDYRTREWMLADEAWFVLAGALRTPMASSTAALASEQAARELVAELGGGEILRYRGLREALDGTGCACGDACEGDCCAGGAG